MNTIMNSNTISIGSLAFMRWLVKTVPAIAGRRKQDIKEI